VKHLIFFDSHCPFCRAAVSKIMKRDTSHLFAFAPLDGKTIEKWLDGPREANTLILLENTESPHPKTWTAAKGAFRILFLLGGKWKLIGWLYLIPGLDLFYHLFARHRHHFQGATAPDLDKSRLLP